MNECWGKSGQANGDILRTLRRWRAVLHPLPCINYDRLSRFDIEFFAFHFYVQASEQHNRIFIEFRSLTGF